MASGQTPYDNWHWATAQKSKIAHVAHDGTTQTLCGIEIRSDSLEPWRRTAFIDNKRVCKKCNESLNQIQALVASIQDISKRKGR